MEGRVHPMAGNGRKAHKDAGGTNPVLRKPDGMVGPDLPEGVLSKNRSWNPHVVDWYDQFRMSPQASLIRSDPMWMALQVAFIELDEMIYTGRYGSMGPEVRQMFAQFGWTPASLRAMRFDVPEADDLSASENGETGAMIDFEDFRRRQGAVG